MLDRSTQARELTRRVAPFANLSDAPVSDAPMEIFA